MSSSLIRYKLSLKKQYPISFVLTYSKTFLDFLNNWLDPVSASLTSYHSPQFLFQHYHHAMPKMHSVGTSYTPFIQPVTSDKRPAHLVRPYWPAAISTGYASTGAYYYGTQPKSFNHFLPWRIIKLLSLFWKSLQKGMYIVMLRLNVRD